MLVFFSVFSKKAITHANYFSFLVYLIKLFKFTFVLQLKTSHNVTLNIKNSI